MCGDLPALLWVTFEMSPDTSQHEQNRWQACHEGIAYAQQEQEQTGSAPGSLECEFTPVSLGGHDPDGQDAVLPMADRGAGGIGGKTHEAQS